MRQCACCLNAPDRIEVERRLPRRNPPIKATVIGLEPLDRGRAFTCQRVCSLELKIFPPGKGTGAVRRERSVHQHERHFNGHRCRSETPEWVLGNMYGRIV
jgi:hypothetical protein